MKTAISIPDDIFEAAEQLAKARGLKRSELYKLAIKDYLERHANAGVTESLNRFYAANPPERDPVLEEFRRQSMLKVEWEG